MAKADTQPTAAAVAAPPAAPTTLTPWREQLPRLVRPGVTLREPVPADAVALFTTLPPDAPAQVLVDPPPASLAGFHAFVERVQAARRLGQVACWAIVPDESDVPVGIIGVRAMDPHASMVEGFAVLAQIARGFGDVQFLLAEFATLFAVGWVLTQVRMKTGALWAGIGLHGGWVFGLKYFSALTLYQTGWLPWIGPNLKIGLAPLVTVLFTGWLVLRLLPKKAQ